MKYISLLNPITIKYLIDNPNTKYFIINTLKLILNDENFELLNYFTHEEENVRSRLRKYHECGVWQIFNNALKTKKRTN